MNFVEYFAIGSMMNPVSLKMRGLNPIKSRPGVLKRFELIFVMAHGMAAARRCKSSEFSIAKEIHGVLHRVTRAEMDMLNKLESTYVVGERVMVEVYKDKHLVTDREGVKDDSIACYDRHDDTIETSVEATVYVLNDELVSKDPKRFAQNPPSERYIEILKGGAMHYGLNVINNRRVLILYLC